MATATSLEPRRRARLRPLHVIGGAIIVLAVVLAFYSLQSALRPYTTQIAEATASERGVQLAGFLGSTGAYDQNGNFTFDLQDSTGAMIKVVYPKPKPSNFEQAVSIVAIGHYDSASGVFMADDLLVKCPSKYQEQLDQAKG